MKPSIVIISALLVILIILFSVFNPHEVFFWRAGSGPTPTTTPLPTSQRNGPALHRQVGDTRGLRIGAAVIVLIILGGILIQNQGPSSPSSHPGEK